jgi:hypothetical protein
MVPVLTSAIFLQEKSNAMAVPGDEVGSRSGQVRGELGEGVSVLMGEEGRLEMVGRGDLGEFEEELSRELLLVSLILDITDISIQSLFNVAVNVG